MKGSGFQFDARQPYQLDAISSVVDLFDGQPKDAEKLVTTLRGAAVLPDSDQSALDIDLTQEVGAVGNSLVLACDLILANLQRVQDRNGLEVASSLAGDALDFDIGLFNLEVGVSATRQSAG